MDGHRSRNIALTTLVAGALALVGCAPAVPGPSASPDASTPAPSAMPTASESSAAALDVPPVADGEVTRAVFDEDGGEGGIPETAITVSGAVEAGVPFVVMGECVGDSMDFEVLRAAVDDHDEVLTSGTLVCGEPLSNGSITTPWSGPAQLSVTSSDGVESAWIVVRSE